MADIRADLYFYLSFATIGCNRRSCGLGMIMFENTPEYPRGQRQYSKTPICYPPPGLR